MKKIIALLLAVMLVIMAAMLVICSCRKADSSGGNAEIKTEKTEDKPRFSPLILYRGRRKRALLPFVFLRKA